MAEKAKTPAIRFKSFTNAWEQRKLFEVSSKVIEKNTSMSYSETFTNSAEFGIISQRDFFNHDISNSKNLNGYYVVRNDDFVYNPRISTFAPVGPINRNNLGRCGVMSPLYTVFRTHDIDNTFLEKYFKGRYWHNFMRLNGDSGARSDRFSIKDSIFIEMPIPCPKKSKEQKQIGTFFKSLDNLITLQQRKLKKLKNIKKAMLEKMFPKNGNNVPEIRFAGFTDVWEERKLRDLCVLFTDGDWIESKDQSDSGVRLVQTGNVGIAEYLEKPNNRKWISEETFKKLNCEEVLQGDILISRLPEPAGRACIMPFSSMKMITAVDCTIVRTSSDCSNKFLIQYLSSQDYFNEVNTALAGGTRQRISRSNLANFYIPTPANYKEQEAIGQYFKTLDNLITLNQRKLEKLQNIKKACLEKMFV